MIEELSDGGLLGSEGKTRKDYLPENAFPCPG